MAILPDTNTAGIVQHYGNLIFGKDNVHVGTVRKAKQAQLIHKWKPWQSAGVKTPEGKKRSCMNALKHGLYTAEFLAEKKKIHQLLRE